MTFQLEQGRPYPFGANKLNGGINFAVYAKDVQKISLCFFNEDNLKDPVQEFQLDPEKNKKGDVWHALIKGISSPTVYGYRVTANDKNFQLLDPYAKGVASDPNWHEDTSQEIVYSPLGKVFPNDSFNWENDRSPNIPKKDLVIYEMHVRGFTKHPSSKVQNPGTYKGIIEKIPYLLELGVNAIELMPINEFNELEVIAINPETKAKLHNFFGYSTVNFFSPMNRYASQSKGDQAIDEFKTMVKELHKKGIEVILDIVFNHTSEGNEKGPTYTFKGFDPHAYYMINDHGEYLNFSGCGNTFNCNHPITIELIIDALRYWVTDMHVDGFRFDLVSILTRTENGGPIENPPIIEAISKDPILSQVKIIGEPWDPGGLYQLGFFAGKYKRWSEWNGKYRDIVRRFIKGTPGQKNPFAGVIFGCHDVYGASGAPHSSINFVTAHDGFSLADLVSYNEKHNLINGEENRDGMNENDSWNCGFEGHTDNKKIINLRNRQMRSFVVALMLSQGIPMVLMGDEYGHTRNGNNNTWCQDNELNWFLWDQKEKNPGFFRFYQRLINFRKSQSLLKRDTFLTDKEIQWHGVNPSEPEWDNDNRFIAFTLNNPDGLPGIYVAFNAAYHSKDLNLPSPGDGKAWYWIVNTHNPSPKDFYDFKKSKKLQSASYKIQPYCTIVLSSGQG